MSQKHYGLHHLLVNVGITASCAVMFCEPASVVDTGTSMLAEVQARLAAGGVQSCHVQSESLRRLVAAAGDHGDAEWCVDMFLSSWRSAAPDTESVPLGLFNTEVEAHVQRLVASLSAHVSQLDCLVLWMRWCWEAETLCNWPFGKPSNFSIPWCVSPSVPASVLCPAFCSQQKWISDAVTQEAHAVSTELGLREAGIDLTDGRYLFHGTSHASAAAIAEHGIDIRKCRDKTDFGRGFYLGNELRDALGWAYQVTQHPGRLPAVLVYAWGRAQDDAAVFHFEEQSALWNDFVILNRGTRRAHCSLFSTREAEVLDTVTGSVLTGDQATSTDSWGTVQSRNMFQCALVTSRECLRWRTHLAAVVFYCDYDADTNAEASNVSR